MQDQELVVLDPSNTGELTISRPPSEVLQEAQKAAAALKDIISKKSKPVMFNGEQYLEFEDWQTIGRFYGLAAKVQQTRPVTFGDIQGFEAEAVVIHTGTSKEVSRAEAMCLSDEPNWSRKPLFQLRSMAQTRACAKALRNVLAWVVVLAGYRPTPAEEMDSVIRPQPKPQSKPAEDGNLASLKQTADSIASKAAEDIAKEESERLQAQSAAERARQLAQEHAADVPCFSFGKHKGKSPFDASVPDDYLAWVEPKIAESINDPSRARYQATNQALLDAVRSAAMDRGILNLPAE